MPRVRSADQATCLLFADEQEICPYAVVEGTVHVVAPTPELVARWMGEPPEQLRGVRVVDRLLSGKRVFLVVRPMHPVLIFEDSDG